MWVLREEGRRLAGSLAEHFVLSNELIDVLIRVFLDLVELKVHALVFWWHLLLLLGILRSGEGELGVGSVVLFSRFRNIG